MPTLDQHPSSSVVRLLNIGESGTGKTGALASLAKAGYRLWILDYDNGLDVLVNLLRNDPASLKRITYKFLRDPIVMTNGVPKLRPPMSAWKDAGKTLNEWGAESWGPEDVLVIDTLTTASQAAFNEALALAGRLNQRPQQNDYGWMADSVLLFIGGVTDADNCNYNVIVNTHVRYLSGDEEAQTFMQGLPNAKGQQIPKDIGKFFNSIVHTKIKGSGPAAKRVISTKPAGVVQVKTSAPTTAKDEYPIESGLADLFKDILGHGPEAPPRTSSPAATAPEKVL